MFYEFGLRKQPVVEHRDNLVWGNKYSSKGEVAITYFITLIEVLKHLN